MLCLYSKQIRKEWYSTNFKDFTSYSHGKNIFLYEERYILLYLNKSYIERLNYLSLPTLRYRRSRGDMILVYKIITGIIAPNTACSFIKVTNSITRGNCFKLYQGQVHYDLNKYNFNNRVVPLWNSLPNYVVNACSVKSFEIKFDIFWKLQPSYWDYKYRS